MLVGNKKNKNGRVYLVGAGPGDPGLITVKGRHCLQEADVVIYDYLANEQLLKLAKNTSKKIYVGKKGKNHSVEQSGINKLMIREARKGQSVVRLKGGDPYIFGRGGEEAQALVEAGILYEVVPGITSAIAVPAYAGIPLTHRDFTPSVTFITGHEKADGKPLSPNWKALAQLQSLVFLMGTTNLGHIAAQLTRYGMSPKTPCAVIEWGTYTRQRKVIGTLATIVAKCTLLKITPPTITVVGDVVNLSEKLAWFDQKPLFGKRILVTRSRHQISEIADRLELLGAEVVEVPTIEFLPPKSWKSLDKGIRDVQKYTWILFSSANGVTTFFDRLKSVGEDVRCLHGVKIGAIGPATAATVESHGIHVDMVAKEFRSEGLIAALTSKKQSITKERFLVVRAHETREMIGGILKSKGAQVDEVEAYRMTLPKKNAALLKQVLEEGLDMAVFASSNTARNYLELAKVAGSKVEKMALAVPTAVIGPITRKSAEQMGLTVAVQPEQSTMPDLVEAIVGYFE